MAIKKELESYVKQIEQLCAVTFDKNKDIQQQIRMLIDRLCSLYKERESKEIAPLLLWMDNKELKFPKEMYTEPVMLKFENIYVPAPCEYDYVLKKNMVIIIKLCLSQMMHMNIRIIISIKSSLQIMGYRCVHSK